MGCDRNKEKKSEELISCNNKIRHREKSPKSHFKECNCVQATEKCPFENLPPPAAPGGREDLWELQFCRWWGWNWVKKPEEKCNAKRSTENDQFPVKLPCSKSKKATFFTEIPKSCPAAQISPKEQFKTMCKCLLGRKKAPDEMANLYNTPSTSQIALQSEERVRYGVGAICKNPKKCSKKNKSIIECHSKKIDNSKYLCNEDSTTFNSTIMSESEPKKADCIISTEESVEYLTIKLQQQQIGQNCPCLNNNNKEANNTVEERKKESRNCAALAQKISSEKEINKTTSKNTQTTCSTTENVIIKDPETNNNNNNLQQSSTTNYTEKLIKLKGKKHKTICIMVCCCGSCNNNNNNKKPMENSNSVLKNKETIISVDKKKCICKNCPKLCWQNNLIDMDNDETNADEINLCNCCKKNKENLKNDTTPKCAAAINNNSQLQNVATFPIHSINNPTKIFEKFGTPTKNYQWIEQQTDSNITRTDLLDNNSSNIYDWLENELQNKKTVNFLENLNKISPKSGVEERILLDAVCDAILQEHEDKTNNYFLNEFKLNNCTEINTNNNNYKDFGILCNLKNEEFSSDIIFHHHTENLKNNEKEDVGVQIIEKNKSALLENLNYSDDGIFLNTLLENIYSSKLVNVEEEITKNSQSRKSIKRELSASEDFPKDTKKKVKRDNNNNNNTSIDSIFSRIDDIVLKSKEKTAEIQKVLNYSSDQGKKPQIFQPEEINNNNKRNYPMSSDNFKGYLYENNITSFYQNNELLSKSCCESNTIILNRKNSMNNEILNEKLSKLSINSFMVFNEKSTVDLPSSSSNNNNNNHNNRIIKKKNNNNTINKISLIPIKK